MITVARKRRPRSKNYFTKDTENAIVRYNNEPNPEIRSKIYRDEIHYAFFKLTENIIHTFKFYYTEVDQIEHLQHEVITFLLSKLHLFNPDNGAKAYSYFGTIVKRWLINYNNKNYKKLKQIGSWDDVEDGYMPDVNENDDIGITLAQFMDKWIAETYEILEDIFKKESELHIADAVLTIFRTRNDLEIFKKKALYIYIREITDCDTPSLTRVITKLKLDFQEKYQKLYDEGLISNKVL